MEMVGIAIFALGAMAAEAIVRRRKQRAKPKRRGNGPLPKELPVFLGHDRRWTPTYPAKREREREASEPPTDRRTV